MLSSSISLTDASPTERPLTLLGKGTRLIGSTIKTSLTIDDVNHVLLDGFFGRTTPQAWRLNASVPIPKDTMRPGLEGTGPAIDLGMAMGALNTDRGSTRPSISATSRHFRSTAAAVIRSIAAASRRNGFPARSSPA